MRPLKLSLLAVIALIPTTLLADDVDIAVKELPAVVTAAITEAHPAATLLSAEKELKADGTTESFEVKIRDGKSKKELTILPDGTIKKTENED